MTQTIPHAAFPTPLLLVAMQARDQEAPDASLGQG